jgi:hypothetical protein
LGAVIGDRQQVGTEDLEAAAGDCGARGDAIKMWSLS